MLNIVLIAILYSPNYSDLLGVIFDSTKSTKYKHYQNKDQLPFDTIYQHELLRMIEDVENGRLIFIEHLQSARPFARLFTCIVFFNPRPILKSSTVPSLEVSHTRLER